MNTVKYRGNCEPTGQIYNTQNAVCVYGTFCEHLLKLLLSAGLSDDGMSKKIRLLDGEMVRSLQIFM